MTYLVRLLRTDRRVCRGAATEHAEQFVRAIDEADARFRVITPPWGTWRIESVTPVNNQTGDEPAQP